MMKSIAVTLLLVAPTLISAQVVSQKAITSPQGEPLVERMVFLPDPQGKQVLVKQVLKPNEDGSFTYIPALQSSETLKFDQDFCARVGGVASFTSQGVLGKDTLFGVSCLSPATVPPKVRVMTNGVWQERSKEESDKEKRNDSTSSLAPSGGIAPLANLIILQAYAPKNFAVPARQNVLYQGYTQYLTNVAGYLASRLQIGNGCYISQQDWMKANSNGTAMLWIVCYANGITTIDTSMTTCLQGVCSIDRGKVTVI